MINETVYFNNFDLASLDGVQIYNHDFIGMPNRNISSSKLARSDKSLLTSAEYKDKTVTVDLFVCGTSKSSTEENYDRLKGSIQTSEGTLRIEQGGSQVEYVGTLSGISKEYFGPKLKVTVSFFCSNPIGADQNPTTLLNINNTSATTTELITVGGSFKTFPTYLITFNSLTGGSAKTVSLLNPATNQGIRILRDWAALDILRVDPVTLDVTVNGVVVDYDGTFPVYYPGSRSFQYIDDMTARNQDILITYNKQYA